MPVKRVMFAALGAVFAVGAGTFDIPDFVWENADADKRVVKSVALKGLKPGMRAELEMWVDASDLTNSMPEASLAWDSTSGKTWAGSSGGTVKRWNDPTIEKDSSGRRKFNILTPVFPCDATNFKLYFFAAKPAIGRIRYSAIKMTLSDRVYSARMTSAAYRGEAFDGEVRFAASFITDPASEPLDSLAAHFVFKGVDGKTVRRAADRLAQDSAQCTVPVSFLAMGTQDVLFELSLKTGGLLSRAATSFARLGAPSDRRVAFDRFGRTVVGGNLFFPLGMYWSERTLEKPKALERYTAPGVFNSLQTYERAMTPKLLDLYHANGLMVVASVKDVFAPGEDRPPRTFPPKSVTTRTDEARYVAEVVDRCKNHPALLAWYTCDEFSARFAGRLEERYRLMRRLDPEHPVFVLAFTDAIRPFLGALDVGGTDPYPVCSPWGSHAKWMKARPDEGCVWEAGRIAVDERNAMFGLKPMWQVPQAFMWAWDYGGEGKRPALRFPTRLELSSMTWQQIAAGANGIFFYSYGQILHNCRNEGEIHKYFDETTVPVAREVKDMMHVLLLEPGSAAVKIPKRILARTWKGENGSVFALVCNTHPERRKGFVSIPGEWKSCTPVFGRGVALAEDGRLKLDMPDLASAIVELK